MSQLDSSKPQLASSHFFVFFIFKWFKEIARRLVVSLLGRFMNIAYSMKLGHLLNSGKPASRRLSITILTHFSPSEFSRIQLMLHIQ